MKVYEADGDTQVVFMRNIDDDNDTIDPTEDMWIRLSEYKKKIRCSKMLGIC